MSGQMMIEPLQLVDIMLWHCNKHEQGAEENNGT